jgi:hexosaminidase
VLAGCANLRLGEARPVSASPPEHVVSPPAISIVPQPRSVRVAPGAYVWPSAARIGIDAPAGKDLGERLNSFLARNHVLTIWAARGGATDIVVHLRGSSRELGNEGYELRVQRRGITIRANAAPGVFYALQTLDQITTRSAGHLVSRFVTVVDRPEYRWRGIHLDVVRHFFPVPVVKRYIDVAARYKLNVFHWHLTDDQAWRLQSARYPALTASRPAYSARDVRDVVAYAARRYVTVVPEIEMPAHTTAALRAYPQIACGWTLCQSGAGLEFARTVLAEAMTQFPSRYVHAGGDEVSPPASFAQPAFTRAIEGYVESRGRRFVAWDDVFTPGLSRRVTVMTWTGPERAAKIARHGSDVIVTSPPLYFDAAQGDPAQEPPASTYVSTLEQVYADSVMPPGLRRADAAHVIGVQANVWTEHIATADQLFRMTLPRELALAEIAWTPRSKKNWSSFLARLPLQFAWLEAHGYPFRIPNASFALTGGPAAFEATPEHLASVEVRTTAAQLRVSLSVPLAGAVIRYTTDGAVPSAVARAYRRPFTLRLGRVPIRIRAAAFRHGHRGAVTAAVVTRVTPAELHARVHASRSWAALVSP